MRCTASPSQGDGPTIPSQANSTSCFPGLAHERCLGDAEATWPARVARTPIRACCGSTVQIDRRRIEASAIPKAITDCAVQDLRGPDLTHLRYHAKHIGRA